ncbi:hypothetical protein X975_24275, partial [Stegodyphus mimosarum]
MPKNTTGRAGVLSWLPILLPMEYTTSLFRYELTSICHKRSDPLFFC